MKTQGVARSVIAAVVHHQTEARRYLPLQHIRAGQASFDVYDSVLNEEALLAFEYGYSTSAPQQLVIWEAQFVTLPTALRLLLTNLSRLRNQVGSL